MARWVEKEINTTSIDTRKSNAVARTMSQSHHCHVQRPLGAKHVSLLRFITVSLSQCPSLSVQVLTYDHTHTVTSMLFPAVTRTADMVAVSPGTWPYQCDVQDHLVAGMHARLVVTA